MKVLELFAGTRSIGKAFASKGHEVFSIEWDKNFENIDLYADVLTVTAEDILARFGKPDVIWASPDCTTFSIAAISHHRRKNTETGNLDPVSDYAKFCDQVDVHVLELIKELDPKYYFIENPRGGMRKMSWMQGLPRYTVTYCQYGDTRMKPTDIWTNHPDPKFKPMCKNGDPCHVPAPRGSATGTQALKGSKERSVIPDELCRHIVDICEENVKCMKVLVACEESQAVTKELRALGHEAYSCDIQECSGGHPEWHCCEDVLPLLNGNCTFKTVDGVKHTIKGKWDMILAFPPCTHLAVSGARHFETKRADGRQREGIEFFCKFLEADCDRISIENPVNIISGDYIPKWFPDIAEKYGLPIKPTQIIQPWQFGDKVGKSTCLWLKGLQPLVGHVKEKPPTEYKEWVGKDGRKKRQEMWYFDALKAGADRGKIRSKTFKGVAHAMANQWAGPNTDVITEVEDMVKVEDKITVFEGNDLINLVALKEKEPELYDELLADYPCESGTYIFKNEVS